MTSAYCFEKHKTKAYIHSIECWVTW